MSADYGRDKKGLVPLFKARSEQGRLTIQTDRMGAFAC